MPLTKQDHKEAFGPGLAKFEASLKAIVKAGADDLRAATQKLLRANIAELKMMGATPEMLHVIEGSIKSYDEFHHEAFP